MIVCLIHNLQTVQCYAEVPESCTLILIELICHVAFSFSSWDSSIFKCPDGCVIKNSKIKIFAVNTCSKDPSFCYSREALQAILIERKDLKQSGHDPTPDKLRLCIEEVLNSLRENNNNNNKLG